MTSPKLSPEMENALRHEEFVKKALAIRNGGNGKPLWRLLLESSGVVALITVIGGGIITSIITGSFQKSTTERQFQHEIIRLYSEHTLEEQAEFLKNRTETRKEAVELVGKALSRARARIAVDSREFARRRNTGSEKTNKEQIEKIKMAFNESLETWGTRKKALGISLGLFFGSGSEQAWDTVAEHLDDYLLCARYHAPSAEEKAGSDICIPSYEAVESSLDDFRQATWEGTGPEWLTSEEINRIRTVLGGD